MKLLDEFEICRKSSGYNKTWCNLDWKIVNEYMYFQQSRDKTDWFFNIISAIRIPWRLAGTWFIFPLGFLIMWLSVECIVNRHPVKGYRGYSQGGPFASYSSAKTGKPAITFGCPHIGIGNENLFENVTHYKTPTDIVTKLPTWAKSYGQTMILQGTFIIKENMTPFEYAEMLTGHTQEEYRQRMDI